MKLLFLKEYSLSLTFQFQNLKFRIKQRHVPLVFLWLSELASILETFIVSQISYN